MHSYALTSRHQVLRRNQNTTRYRSIAEGLGPISHTLFVALLVAIIGLIYLSQLTRASEFGYQVNDLKDRQVELVTENQLLQDEAARLQALERIKNSDVAKGLETVNQFEFTQTSNQ